MARGLGVHAARRLCAVALRRARHASPLQLEARQIEPSAFATATLAIARSWIARPSSRTADVRAARRPSALPVSTRPTPLPGLRRDDAGLDAAASSPPCEACSRVVAEEVGARQLRRRDLGLALPAPHPRPSTRRPSRREPLGVEHARPRRHRDDDVAPRARRRATGRRAPRGHCATESLPAPRRCPRPAMS